METAGRRRGPASESQTLIVAYPYKDAVDLCDTYDAFISATRELDLRVVKEDVVHRGHTAYRIVVADHDVDIEAASAQLPDVQREFHVRLISCHRTDILTVSVVAPLLLKIIMSYVLWPRGQKILRLNILA